MGYNKLGRETETVVKQKWLRWSTATPARSHTGTLGVRIFCKQLTNETFHKFDCQCNKSIPT